MRRNPHRSIAVLAASLALVAAACGDVDASSDAAEAADPARPTVVVTTNILGNVVDELVGDQADVVTIMPVGADPHDFQPSAQEVNAMVGADALIANGADFEEGLVDVIENAGDDGVPTFAAIDAVDTIEFSGTHGHDDEHDDEDHAGEETHDEGTHDDEDTHDEHDHEGVDPHFFNDPLRMVQAVEGMTVFLADVDGIDATTLAEASAAYIEQLESLHDDVLDMVETIPDERRVLVTNHEVFGYFADRYGFEIVGTVIPGGGTTDGVSPAELAELAEVIEAEGVPAIFSDTSASSELVDALAAEVGDIAVVELYTESLGEPGSPGETYLSMVRTNAERIGEALSPA